MQNRPLTFKIENRLPKSDVPLKKHFASCTAIHPSYITSITFFVTRGLNTGISSKPTRKMLSAIAEERFNLCFVGIVAIAVKGQRQKGPLLGSFMYACAISPRKLPVFSYMEVTVTTTAGPSQFASWLNAAVATEGSRIKTDGIIGLCHKFFQVRLEVALVAKTCADGVDQALKLVQQLLFQRPVCRFLPPMQNRTRNSTGLHSKGHTGCGGPFLQAP